MNSSQVILEAIIVGVYAIVIYLVVHNAMSITIPYISKMKTKIMYTLLIPLSLYIVGFLKHFLGHFILQPLYCTYGYACRTNRSMQSKDKTTDDEKALSSYKPVISMKSLTIESLLEGFIFMIVGLIIYSLTGNIYVTIFVNGFIFHVASEALGIHTSFCKRCKRTHS